MAKNKKQLDKDIMFQKIMPVLAGNPFADLSGTEQFQQQESNASELSILRARLAPQHKDTAPQHPMPRNAEELAVDGLIDQVIQKFNCCACDHCRRAIAAEALNALPPCYMAEDGQALTEAASHIDSRNVYNALIKAVLKIRTNPPHNK